nr:inactive protein RESTRICTED TEV MOVEMENT 1-like [Ipomoea batatas]
MFKLDLMPPCSGYGCTAWDDVSLGQVVGIVICYDSSRICSLRFIYLKDSVYKMAIHGEIRESCQTIILDYPTEFLTGVNGYRNISYVVKCITFVTNKATHGPFGNQSLGQYDRTFGCNQGGKDNRWITGFYDHTGSSYRVLYWSAWFYYNSTSNTNVIRCITFVTNKATYGPFGGSPSSTAESAFSLQLWGKESDRITGFFGTFDNNNLTSFGVYIQKSIARQSWNEVKRLYLYQS